MQDLAVGKEINHTIRKFVNMTPFSFFQSPICVIITISTPDILTNKARKTSEGGGGGRVGERGWLQAWLEVDRNKKK